MKSIILYYSRSGTTESLAKRIQSDLDIDAIKIEPKRKYGSYLTAVIRVMFERLFGEQKSSTPAPDLSDYDTVFIGYPVWYQDLPAFIGEFLSRCNLEGKRIVPFASFGATDVNYTLATLQEKCHGAEIVYPYNNGMMKKDDYESWISKFSE